MSLLRRVLGVGAVLLLALSVPLVVLPRTIVETIMGQGQVPDVVWIRLFGAGGVALALFHVLILRKLEDLWWWCWAFVIFDGLTSLIVILHVSAGLNEGSAAWPWWTFGASTAVFTALYVVGLAKAGQEKPLT
jgi:hypothetical protein